MLKHKTQRFKSVVVVVSMHEGFFTVYQRKRSPYCGRIQREKGTELLLGVAVGCGSKRERRENWDWSRGSCCV